MTEQTKEKPVSFLHETQREGHGKAVIEKKDLDEAIATVHTIMNKDVAKEVKTSKEEDLPGIKIDLYCHDCRSLVPAGVGHGRRGKMRTVCGSCKSKKISSGRKEALESFYHIKENEQRRKDKGIVLEKKDFSKPRPKRKFKKRPAKNMKKREK